MTFNIEKSEIEQALQIANAWLDGQMNSFQMIPGDPDCDACVVARQLIRQREGLEKAVALAEQAGKEWESAVKELAEKSLQLDKILATFMAPDKLESGAVQIHHELGTTITAARKAFAMSLTAAFG